VVLKVCDELDKAKELHEYFKKKLTSYIQQVVIKELDNKEEEVLLEHYIRQWKNYTIFSHFICKMFSYLDRYYLKNNNTVLLATTALHLFRDHCFNNVYERVRKAILNQMTRDRNNEMVDIELVKRSIYTFVEMGYVSATIAKEGDDYIFKGDKNNEVQYVQKFQVELIRRVSPNFAIISGILTIYFLIG
jgi:Cullin family